MTLPHQTDSCSPPSLAGFTTRAAPGPHNDTAQPSLTSGFGTVIAEERDLKSSTEGLLSVDDGAHATSINRILRHQLVQLRANIALLEQRYETLPHPARFHALHEGRPSARAIAIARERGFDGLANLAAMHLRLLDKIDTLIAQRPDGQRGELILSEVARNHDEMAWMLTALVKEDVSVRDMLPLPVTAAAPTLRDTTVENWENEGGAADPVAAAGVAPAGQRRA